MEIEEVYPQDAARKTKRLSLLIFSQLIVTFAKWSNYFKESVNKVEEEKLLKHYCHPGLKSHLQYL